MDSTHFLFRQGKVYPYWYACKPYLYKCGVLDVICLLPGFTTTSLEADEISSTLSFYITNHQSLELGWRILLKMELPSELDTKIVLWEIAVSENQPTEELEFFFKQYISQNQAFSKEDIYKIVKQHNHACSLNFIPTSKAYEMFGASLTLTDMLFDSSKDEEIMLRAFLNGEKHYGLIKGVSTDELTPEQKDYLQNTGIDMSNIYEIESL